jgi:hypothetical protein
MLPGASLSLQITQQFAKLGLDIEKGKLEIRQPKAQLEITQKPAKMRIDQGIGVLQMDGEDRRAVVGLKSMSRMNADIARQALQISLEATGEISSEGDQLSQINGPTIADIALQKQETQLPPIYQPDSVGQVHITYNPHPTKIEWTLGGTQIDVKPQPPEIQFTPGGVHPYIMQKNWLHIDVKGKYMDQMF